MKKIVALLILLIGIFVSSYVYSSELDRFMKGVLNMDRSSVVEIKESSNNGNEFASLIMAYLYYDGIIVDRNKDISLHYLNLIKNNKKLLGEKFFLLASWELDKANPDPEKVKEFFLNSIQYGNKSSVLSFGMYLYGSENSDDKINASKYFLQGQSNKEREGFYYEYALVFEILNEIDRGNLDYVKRKFNKSKNELDTFGFPMKYFLYISLINEGILGEDNKRAYSLLTYDIDWLGGRLDPKTNPQFPLLVKQARKYLSNFISKLSKKNLDYYKFCDRYGSDLKNKCYRLVIPVTALCEPLDEVSKLVKGFRQSIYFNRCKEIKFLKYSNNIRSW